MKYFVFFVCLCIFLSCGRYYNSSNLYWKEADHKEQLTRNAISYLEKYKGIKIKGAKDIIDGSYEYDFIEDTTICVKSEKFLDIYCLPYNFDLPHFGTVTMTGLKHFISEDGFGFRFSENDSYKGNIKFPFKVPGVGYEYTGKITVKFVMTNLPYIYAQIMDYFNRIFSIKSGEEDYNFSTYIQIKDKTYNLSLKKDNDPCTEYTCLPSLKYWGHQELENLTPKKIGYLLHILQDSSQTQHSNSVMFKTDDFDLSHAKYESNAQNIKLSVDSSLNNIYNNMENACKSEKDIKEKFDCLLEYLTNRSRMYKDSAYIGYHKYNALIASALFINWSQK